MEIAKDSVANSPGSSVLNPFFPSASDNSNISSTITSDVYGIQTPDFFNGLKDDTGNFKGESSAGMYHSGIVDTAAPFESVKEVVSKFGGIVDWKAHKAMAVERQKNVKLELRKAQEELPMYRKQSERAEGLKEQALKELDKTKRMVEELKLKLEKALTEEAQAKQDSELAVLRVKEMEQGIGDDVSVAAKTQLEVAKARHEAAVTDLISVKKQLEELKGEYEVLVKERDLAVKKAEKAVAASREIEKTVEDLTLELITTKESLESAHASHLEAEESRISAALAAEQDSHCWEKELKKAKDELMQLNEQLSLSNNLKWKLDTSSALLLNLKKELATYMEAKLHEENSPGMQAQEVVVSIRKELEEVKQSIEKAKEEAECLRVATSRLKSEIECEKEALSILKQKEEMSLIAISSLESELKKASMDLELAFAKGKQFENETVELPSLLQQATQEAKQAKGFAASAREELEKAKEEAEQAKAQANTVSIRLHAALKEVEASKASELLAVAAVKALEESENNASNTCDITNNSVSLSFEEYRALSEKAREAEDMANKKVILAIEQINDAKVSESVSLTKLEELTEELSNKKEALRVAIEEAEKAREGKLSAEQELRTWRAEHEQRRKASDASLLSQSTEEYRGRSSYVEEETIHSANSAMYPKLYISENNTRSAKSEAKMKKKKSLFPRIVMFLARKKAQSLK